MQFVDRSFADSPLLFKLLAHAHRPKGKTISSLVEPAHNPDSNSLGELCLETGFEQLSPRLFRADGFAGESPSVFLSHNRADSDAVIIRPIGWIEQQLDRELLRHLMMEIPNLPSGGFASANLGERKLLFFLEHLATQSLDASEVACALVSARIAGVAAGIDQSDGPIDWFSRPIDDSVTGMIDDFLLGRAVSWKRAPASGRSHSAWICEHEGAVRIAAYHDTDRGILVLARAYQSFVGSPKPELCARLLRANIQLLDGRFAAIRDGAHGAIVTINHLCCDDLDEVELARAVGYLERLSIRGAQTSQTSLELLRLIESTDSSKYSEFRSLSEPLATAAREELPSKISIGETVDGRNLDIPVSDFLTHAFVCGGSGSGKTIVCKNIVEELAMSGVPSIVIDLKGDLSSLACIPQETSQEGLAKYLVRLYGDRAEQNSSSIQTQSASSSELYESSGIGKEDLRAYRDSIEFRILTPRSDIGIPIALSPLAGLDLGSLGETRGIVGNRALHELLESSLRGLVDYLDLSDVDSETLIAVLIQLLETAHREGTSLRGIEGIENLVQMLFDVEEKTDRINFLETVDAVDPKQAMKYARAMNARLGGTFRYWFDGEDFSIDELVAPRNGRTPINIVNLSMLPSIRDQGYAIAQINSQIIDWMRQQAGAQRPRLLYFIDEIAQGGGKEAIFPPHPYNPITKPGLNVLLKQGRAFGVSCLLATQNAKDIDYKGLGQCDTWVVGRLKTALDIDRLKLGLEAADASASTRFDSGTQDILSDVAGLETGHFVIKTRDQGVFEYKQNWIRSVHERMTPEMIKNWVGAEELRIDDQLADATHEWSQGDPAVAIARIESIVNDEPYYSKLLETKLMLCEWLFRTKDWQRVIDYASTLREAVRGRSGFELIHYYEGIAHFEVGALDAARDSLERFVASASQSSDELIEQCRSRLSDLYVHLDDYESLEESARQTLDSRGAEKLASFCRAMKSAVTSWPSLRGDSMAGSTFFSPNESENPDEIRFATKKDREIRSYVADIRRRLDDLPLNAPPVDTLSDEERAHLGRILAASNADAEAQRARRNAVAEAVAKVEEYVDALDLESASDAIDTARKLVFESGLGQDDLDRVISLYRGAASAGANSIRNWLLEIDPFKFELEIASLFRTLGYEAQATKATGDGGIDVCAIYRNRHYVIQCKRYRHSIEPGQIREFATAIRNYDADEGIFVTTSSFTHGCREEAERHEIHLMDMEDLLKLYSTDRPKKQKRRATPKTKTKTARGISNPSDPVREAAVRQVLSAAPEPLLVREIAEASGYLMKDCQDTVATLLGQGDVEKVGKGRGSRYVLA